MSTYLLNLMRKGTAKSVRLWIVVFLKNNMRGPPVKQQCQPSKSDKRCGTLNMKHLCNLKRFGQRELGRSAPGEDVYLRRFNSYCTVNVAEFFFILLINSIY